MVKEMFYRVAYSPTVTEYNATLQELRCYKEEPVAWVEDDKPEQWAASMFGKER